MNSPRGTGSMGRKTLSRTSIKFLAVIMLVVIVINIGIAMFHFDQSLKPRTRITYRGMDGANKLESSRVHHTDRRHEDSSVNQDSDRLEDSLLDSRNSQKESLNGNRDVSEDTETNEESMNDDRNFNEESMNDDRNFNEESMNDDRNFNEESMNDDRNFNKESINDDRSFNEESMNDDRDTKEEFRETDQLANEELDDTDFSELGSLIDDTNTDAKSIKDDTETDEGSSIIGDKARNEGAPRSPEKKTRNEESPSPLILWWDPIAGMTGQTIQCGQRQLQCQVSVDRRRWKEQEIMMLSFYGPSLSPHHLPLPRRGGDLWALFHDESPKNQDYVFSHQPILELFNYTATFRHQADLPFPTQWLRDVNDLTSDKFVVPVSKKSELREKEGLAPVIFVQSDCRVPSDRDHFVTILQQHVKVDSYGSCLNNKPFPNASSLSFKVKGDMSPMTADEFYHFVAQYKFAIAIENAVCPGYITEKFWRPLHLGVVPIVFGAPNIREFLPSKNSALLIDDFNSAEELARAILYYDKHDDEYNKLINFKQTGVTNPALLEHIRKRSTEADIYGTQLLMDYRCMLCEKLHEAISLRKSGKPIPHSVANKDHYGCEKPGKFNNVGKYIPKVTGHWHRPWLYSQAAACVVRKLVQEGMQVSLQTYETMVKETERTFDRECLKYF